jgi:hypothetical protein
MSSNHCRRQDPGIKPVNAAGGSLWHRRRASQVAIAITRAFARPEDGSVRRKDDLKELIIKTL